MTDLGSGAGHKKSAPQGGASPLWKQIILSFYEETRFAEFETMLCIL